MWPELVPPWARNADIEIKLITGKNADGTEKTELVFTGRCNYSEKSRTVLDEQRRSVLLEGVVLVSGDIAPGRDLTGEARIMAGNQKIVRRIYRGSRGRNPDGSVNYTQLEVI